MTNINPSRKFTISPEPAVRWVGNGWKWELVDTVRMHWVGANHDFHVSIPPGTKTDFATVPRYLWWLFPSQGQYNRAAIIHDYLCDEPDTDRAFADAVFLVIMRRTGVPWFRRTPMYMAVWCYGTGKDVWQRTPARVKRFVVYPLIAAVVGLVGGALIGAIAARW